MSKGAERAILLSIGILATLSVSFWMGLFASIIPIGTSFGIYFASKASQSKENPQRIKYIVLFILSLLFMVLGVVFIDMYIDTNFLGRNFP
ncbi:MAG: hypothetical protein AAB417_00945 [Patescibacteria group bacterium]